MSPIATDQVLRASMIAREESYPDFLGTLTQPARVAGWGPLVGELFDRYRILRAAEPRFPRATFNELETTGDLFMTATELLCSIGDFTAPTALDVQSRAFDVFLEHVSQLPIRGLPEDGLPARWVEATTGLWEPLKALLLSLPPADTTLNRADLLLSFDSTCRLIAAWALGHGYVREMEEDGEIYENLVWPGDEGLAPTSGVEK